MKEYIFQETPRGRELSFAEMAKRPRWSIQLVGPGVMGTGNVRAIVQDDRPVGNITKYACAFDIERAIRVVDFLNSTEGEKPDGRTPNL